MLILCLLTDISVVRSIRALLYMKGTILLCIVLGAFVKGQWNSWSFLTYYDSCFQNQFAHTNVIFQNKQLALLFCWEVDLCTLPGDRHITPVHLISDVRCCPSLATLVWLCRENTTLVVTFWKYSENRWLMPWLIWRNNFNIHWKIWFKEQNYGINYWYPIKPGKVIACSVAYIKFHVFGQQVTSLIRCEGRDHQVRLFIFN